VRPKVSIRPSTNGIGMSYFVKDKKGKDVGFAYVWACKVGSKAWIGNLQVAISK
jgi:hypothetical protein